MQDQFCGLFALALYRTYDVSKILLSLCNGVFCRLHKLILHRAGLQ